MLTPLNPRVLGTYSASLPGLATGAPSFGASDESGTLHTLGQRGILDHARYYPLLTGVQGRDSTILQRFEAPIDDRRGAASYRTAYST